MDEAQLVDSFYSKDDFCHVKPCDVLGEDFVLDEHSHQITTGQELHEHVQEGVVLECGVQFNNPRAVRFGENITFRSYVGQLIFFELCSVSVMLLQSLHGGFDRTISCLTSDFSA